MSKWINKNNVSPERIQGSKKLYKETIIADYNKDKKAHKEDETIISTIEFLKMKWKGNKLKLND